MSHQKLEYFQDISQRQRAILRWDNEGGAGPYEPQVRLATNLALEPLHQETDSRKDLSYEINRRSG